VEYPVDPTGSASCSQGMMDATTRASPGSFRRFFTCYSCTIEQGIADFGEKSQKETC
jgi:hypothetical protein